MIGATAINLIINVFFTSEEANYCVVFVVLTPRGYQIIITVIEFWFNVVVYSFLLYNKSYNFNRILIEQ